MGLRFPPRSGPRDSEQGPAEERHEGQEHGLLVVSRAINAAASQQPDGALRRLRAAPVEDTVSRGPELDATANETGHLGSEGAQKRGGGETRKGPRRAPSAAHIPPPPQKVPLRKRNRARHARGVRTSGGGRPQNTADQTHTHTHTRTHTHADRHRQTHPDTHARSRTHRIRTQTVHNHPGGRFLQHRGSSHTARCGTQHRARHPRPTRKAADAGRNAKLRSAPLMAAAE